MVWLGLMVPDELLGALVPIIVYWVYSGILEVMLGSSLMEKYRLHSKKDEDDKNLIPKKVVLKGVLLQHAIQAIVAIILFYATGNKTTESMHTPQQTTTTATIIISIITITPQFIIGTVVLDTWQYFFHRYMHQNKFLCRHIHSYHHRLVVPYGFGALYNHPLEGLVLDTIGGAMAYLASGMTPRASIFFFSFTMIKIVDDHCGLWLPGNILHLFFSNNAAYHDIHHFGNKYNFSQPFFVAWDRILGTYMPYSLEKRSGGGFRVRPLTRN